VLTVLDPFALIQHNQSNERPLAGNYSALKVQLQRELADPRRLRRAENLTADRGQVHIRVWVAKVGYVKRIKVLGAELQIDPLGEVEILVQ
jgi:hypothetical protein